MNHLESLANGVLSSELYNELRRMCQVVVRAQRLPPVPYSPTGQWDQDAFDDLVDLWIVVRRQRLIVWAHEPDWFWWQAERSLKGFILNQRQRTAAVIVYRDVVRTLEADHRFLPNGPGVWGLADWDKDRVAIFDGNEAQIRRVEQGLSAAGALTARGHIRGTWVKGAVTLLLTSLAVWTPAGVLAGALMHVLGDASGTVVTDIEPMEMVSTSFAQSIADDNVEAEALARVVAQEVLHEISYREAQALRAFANTGTISDVAKSLGVSRSAAKQSVFAAIRSVRRRLPMGIPERQVVRAVIDLLEGAR